MSELSNVLLINRQDVMTWTGLDGNLDTDKLLPHVMTATDTSIQPLTGTDLLNKVRKDVKDDTLTGDYETLVLYYITPALVFYTMVDMIPFLSYQIQNGGIFLHQSENATTPTIEEMNQLIQHFRDKAQFYGKALSDYLCDNSTLFDELFTNTGRATSPLYTKTHGGIIWGN